ncbi:MAG: YslB family protein [Lactobacillus sp.]|uniref:YslB family protein n=1 Tax=uncultured Limosilactobacillus sp. TaxID=2837629 RepID=UPI002599D0C7|nr:YslB family protein [uncultured Limosilactobacillus sp.]MCR5280983.1 YslB family protein [Lactobacillus sp.]
MTQTRYDHLINSHRGLGAATLRDIIIPALLGTETEGILYWIGKDLAREYPVATEEELIVLTNQLGMGELSLKKRSATQQIWELGGPIVDERLTLDKETTSFALEAGFLAQEIESQLGSVAEAEVQERGRHTATFLVQNDPQDTSDAERTELVEFIHPQMPTTEEPTSKKRTGLFGRKKKK